ncbi:hypothetical protein [Alteraurantiacibacter aestuarii]|uniref:hypothetical protein n=1 Tax=Alteraurantiacibacter aestuarii TaxID=650004 RepID=UPI0031DD4E82
MAFLALIMVNPLTGFPWLEAPMRSELEGAKRADDQEYPLTQPGDLSPTSMKPGALY